MAVMNRLSPLVVRRVGPLAAVAPFDEPACLRPGEPPQWFDDLRTFATGWVAGLVVFGTFLS